jgi:ribosomal protein L32
MTSEPKTLFSALFLQIIAFFPILVFMVVRMRHTRSHTKNRRSHHKLKNVPITKDADGLPHLKHRMNPTTGKYKGRVVIDMIAKNARKAAKKKEKAASAK